MEGCGRTGNATCACHLPPNARPTGRAAAGAGDTSFQEGPAWEKFSAQRARGNAILFLFARHALSGNRFPLFLVSTEGITMPMKSRAGSGASGAPGAGAALHTAPRNRPAPLDASAEAMAPDRRLASIGSLEDRLMEFTR